MQARLTIEKGEGTPRTFDLGPDRPIKLGRSRDNTIVLHDEHASRAHAEIYHENGQWFIRDGGTLNGTRLNGVRITQATLLQDGQEISIGDTRLRFSLQGQRNGEPAATPPAVKETTETVLPSQPLKDETSLSGLSRTPLLPDEMTALYEFMTVSIEERDPRALVQAALTTVHNHTRATVT